MISGMTQLLASHALSERVVRVEADWRLGDVADEINARRATHAAVFEGGRFRGIVALNSIATQRIFGDLLRKGEVRPVPGDTLIADIAHRMESTLLDAVAVLDRDHSYLGVVTQDSLMRCLILDSQRRFEEIERLKAQQERLRMVGQMTCGVAHELNNALTPVLCYLGLLRSGGGLPPGALSDVDLVLTAAQDAADIVHRLQGFYRPAAGSDRVEAVDMRQLLLDVQALTRPRWRDEALASGATIEFEVSVPRSVSVMGDSGALRELFTNLVFNAVDAMPSGGRIALRLCASGSSAVVEVTDTGCGMSGEQLRRCLEPFYTTKGDRGTGLGLSICQQIVCDHGGRLEVESEPARGATFRVLLPLEFHATVEEDSPDLPVVPRRVLYVDDDQRARQAVARLLEVLHQKVDVAEDAETALRLMKETRYDLLLTDLTLPNVNGMSFTREIRKLDGDLPVVLLTGWACSLAFLGGPPESRPDAVLQKPLSLEALRDVLRQVLRTGERGGSIR